MNLFLFLNGIATFLAQNNQKHLCNPRGLFPWVLTSGRWPKSVKRLFDSAKLPRDYKGYVSNVTDRMNPFFIIHTVSFLFIGWCRKHHPLDYCWGADKTGANLGQQGVVEARRCWLWSSTSVKRETDRVGKMMGTGPICARWLTSPIELRGSR